MSLIFKDDLTQSQSAFKNFPSTRICDGSWTGTINKSLRTLNCNGNGGSQQMTINSVSDTMEILSVPPNPSSRNDLIYDFTNNGGSPLVIPSNSTLNITTQLSGNQIAMIDIIFLFIRSGNFFFPRITIVRNQFTFSFTFPDNLSNIPIDSITFSFINNGSNSFNQFFKDIKIIASGGTGGIGNIITLCGY